jgi:hypothetical protein
LHAAQFGQTATKSQIQAVATFFRSQPFRRLGVIVTTETTLADGLTALRVMAPVLMNRIADVAKWTPFRQLAVVFESSQRADAAVEAAFGDFGLRDNGRPIPTNFFFMPKSAGEPALEVADFIVHAIGRRARAASDASAPDFEAVFHEQDPRFVSFMRVSRAVVS